MKVLKAIWMLLEMMGEAKYAAFLARNGKIQEAMDLYK